MRVRGVGQVLVFNWPKVVTAAAVSVAAFAVAGRLPGSLRRAARCGGALAGWFTVAGLAASWWVYDVSPLYRWTWLRALLPDAVHRHLLVTAGFDEVSRSLAGLLPGSHGRVVDVLDPRGPVEASIRRARRRHPTAAERVRPGELPATDGSIDVVLAIMSAHELRRADDREALFAEAARVLGPGGRLVLVEHHRDLANVLAFGPGALHFYPRAEWERLARAAGFSVLARRTMTPLVTGTAFGRPC